MVNSRMMGGADWRELSWPEYQTMLSAWNAHPDHGGGKPAVDMDGARRALAGALN